jgi:hypothetical protein
MGRNSKKSRAAKERQRRRRGVDFPSGSEFEPSSGSEPGSESEFSEQDFREEKPLIQLKIEEAGHICLFLPKFHCELNPIERYWGYSKRCKSFILPYCST